MRQKAYSAAAVKLLFWFKEFRKTVSLLQSGKTLEEIKVLSDKENIFSAATPMRGNQIFATVSARVSALPQRFFDVFEGSGIETQKLVALTAVMETDALFSDFMNEVYREKLITGDLVLTDADIRVFFLGKQREDGKVAAWTDETLIRLRRCYKMYLAEAGLIERGRGERKIVKPLVDGSLAALLTESGMTPVLKVLTGKR